MARIKKALAELVPELDRDYIRRRAIAPYSYDAIAPPYEAYFEQIAGLTGDGWYGESLSTHFPIRYPGCVR